MNTVQPTTFDSVNLSDCAPSPSLPPTLNGALLIHKDAGISSFGMIEVLQRHLISKFGIKRRDLPKMGHGGTLDPFATGLVVVLIGKSVKLARYFLGANKTYEGTMKFGETTVPGDPTSPISETSQNVPQSLEALRELAHRLTLQPYSQTPPMHSAKKHKGTPLYELARQGIEVEREPKLCHLYDFNILSYTGPDSTSENNRLTSATAEFNLQCSSGTYVRTLAQDFGRILGSLGYLLSLKRTQSGIFNLKDAWSLNQLTSSEQNWNELPCWIPFDKLLAGYDSAEATQQEKEAISQGKQNALFNILKRIKPPAERSTHNRDCLAIYCEDSLFAIAKNEQEKWSIERVFT